MADRNIISQATHDEVIAKRAALWRADKRAIKVFENPGSHKGASYTVDGVAVYPDLIVGLDDGNWIIEEVETSDSVTTAELKQWQTYTKIGVYAFNLLVPSSAAEHARSLTSADPKISVRTYSVSGSSVTFNRN